MTPADRRWRALGKWHRTQRALWMALAKIEEASGREHALRIVLVEMRRLSRRPRAPKPKRRA